MGEGKGAEALDPFWKRLRCCRAQLEAVATDMSQAYINAVEAHLPDATLVFDRFHVVKLMNDKLSDLRRELQRDAEAEAKEVLTGIRLSPLELLDRPAEPETIPPYEMDQTRSW